MTCVQYIYLTYLFITSYRTVTVIRVGSAPPVLDLVTKLHFVSGGGICHRMGQYPEPVSYRLVVTSQNEVVMYKIRACTIQCNEYCLTCNMRMVSSPPW